jgi:hypothetical protein
MRTPRIAVVMRGLDPIGATTFAKVVCVTIHAGRAYPTFRSSVAIGREAEALRSPPVLQQVTAPPLGPGSSLAKGAGRVGDLIRRYPLISYFVIAYAGSWLVWALFVLSQEGSGLLRRMGLVHAD